MIKALLQSICIAVFFFLSRPVIASLIINEIYPAPPSGEYEWVELYNDSPTEVDLTEFLLTDLANNKIKINNSVLPPNGFFIASSSSILNNSGDTVFLKNNRGEVIEIATYSAAFTPDKSYAKCLDNNWLIANIITKNFSNESACLSPTPMPTPKLEPTTTPLPTFTPTPSPIPPSPTPISYDNIFLSEVYSYPQTNENEWVEIYNANDFPVDLTGWYVDDLENGGSSPKIFSANIEPKKYQIISLTSSMFNNNGDSVRLLDFNRNQKDSFEYSGGEKGKSWGRTAFDTDEYCQQEPSQNGANYPCIEVATSKNTITPQSSPKPLPTNKTISHISNNILPASSFPVQNNIIHTPQVKVLGTTTHYSATNRIKPRANLTKSLLFISFSNSLLTIGSILLKIKVYEAFKSFY